MKNSIIISSLDLSEYPCEIHRIYGEHIRLLYRNPPEQLLRDFQAMFAHVSQRQAIIFVKTKKYSVSFYSKYLTAGDNEAWYTFDFYPSLMSFKHHVSIWLKKAKPDES